MPIVHISARLIHWPPCCACCCGPREITVPTEATRVTGTQVIHEETRGWNVPYCERCVDHQDMVEAVEATAGKLDQAQKVVVGCWVAAGLVAGFFLLCLIGAGGRIVGPHGPQPQGSRSGLAEAFGVSVLAIGGVAACGYTARQRVDRLLDQLAQRRSQLRKLLRPDCSCDNAAVEYVRWHGTVHTFEFGSNEFARQFRRLNRNKIVSD